MRFLASLASLVILVTGEAQSPNADAPPAATEAAAEAAALGWLGLVDAGAYAQSWASGARYFRNSILESQWVASIAHVRGSVGALKSRHLLSAKFLRSLPGAPDGEYVVLQFATTFDKKAAATETVTPMKDPDGRWRVSGYYIR